MTALPPFAALRVLEALWRTGSVTGAAEALRVSHSAISFQIRQLEDGSAVRLVRREGRRTVPTPAGAALARVVNESVLAIRHELDLLQLREAAPVTVAANALVFSGWLLPRIAAFRERRPDVAVHLSLVDNDSPVTGDPDILVQFSRSGEVPPGGHRLAGGAAIPVASPGFLARHPVRGAADILRVPRAHDEDSRMWRLWSEAAGLPESAAADCRLYAGSSALAREIALSGQALALCREALIGGDLASGRLVALSDVRVDEAACYTLVTRQGQADRQVVEDVAAAFLAPVPVSGA